MKKLSVLALVLTFVFALTACGGGAPASETAPASEAQPASEAASEAAPESVADEPQAAPALVIDLAGSSVTITCEVNGKYFTEPTRHGIVYEGGGNGDKSMLVSLADELEFHAALVEIGAVPGDNLDLADAVGQTVDGSPLDVTISWDGSNGEIPFADVITSNDPRPMDVRFGGMLAVAEDLRTGCTLCLDSCPAGITSDAAYPFGVTDADSESPVEFFANEEVLPGDGSLVYVTFTLAGA